MKVISIVIPVYNEEKTILQILKRVEDVKLPSDLQKEIIIVDDGSTDKTAKLLGSLDREKYRIFLMPQNRGKGFAIRQGFSIASGDIVLIQDADLEYDPNDYPTLLQPILENKADVVFSSRFIGGEVHRVLYFWHYLGNKFLTFLSNIFTNLNLSDMESGYKIFRKEILDSFKNKLKSERFGIEPELVARVAKDNWRIYEVGISYSGRTYKEGKKINWKDGIAAIWHIIRFNLFS
jgi:glycosyltransferase involved in cell wall biosynthesis